MESKGDGLKFWLGVAVCLRQLDKHALFCRPIFFIRQQQQQQQQYHVCNGFACSNEKDHNLGEEGKIVWE